MNKKVDSILALIDSNLDIPESQSPRCWRCLKKDGYGPAKLCAECREILLNEEYAVDIPTVWTPVEK